MFLLVQACYANSDLSRQRLAITQATLAGSLASQSVKPTVIMTSHPDDPSRRDREALLASTGCDLIVRLKRRWKLHGDSWGIPAGRKIVGRADDDDVLASDFCEKTIASAPESGEFRLVWPSGYVFWRGQLFVLQHGDNQFTAIVTDRNVDPHQVPHLQLGKSFTSKTVETQPGWIWIRHAKAWSSTLPRYRSAPANRIDSSRFAVNLRQVNRVVDELGIPSADYSEHRRPKNAQSR